MSDVKRHVLDWGMIEGAKGQTVYVSASDYDALAAENDKLREILADARSELLHARHFQLTFEGAEVVTRIHAALAEPQAVQPSGERT